MSQRNRQPSRALVYAAVLPSLQAIARSHGYALAVHGSMATDLDLVAVPWVLDASGPQTLVDEIREFLAGVYDVESETGPIERHHGRLAWSIVIGPDYCGFGGPYIDISVMPRRFE